MMSILYISCKIIVDEYIFRTCIPSFETPLMYTETQNDTKTAIQLYTHFVGLVFSVLFLFHSYTNNASYSTIL